MTRFYLVLLYMHGFSCVFESLAFIFLWLFVCHHRNKSFLHTHSNRKTYHPTIQFSADEVLGWWCDCPIGSRIIGCCSHVSSVIWFLSYRRWDSNNTRRTSTDPLTFIRDSIPISDFYDSSDDEDTNTNRYSLA